MNRRGHGLAAVAGVAGTALALTTLSSSFAMSPVALDGDQITEASCSADGGVFAAKGGTRTCTTTRTVTFSVVDHVREGSFEVVFDPSEPDVAWQQFFGQWQSEDVIEFATISSQKDGRAVTQRTKQTLLSYASIPYAWCGQWIFTAEGERLGGGLAEDNQPCIAKGLLPEGSPVEQGADFGG